VLSYFDRDLGNDNLPATRFAVKKPVVINDCIQAIQPCIHVNHPMDIVPISDCGPPNSGVSLGDGSHTKSAIGYKVEGDTALRAENFTKATRHYAAGLEVVNDDNLTLRAELLRQRACAHLKLGRYDEAMEDALHSLSDGEDVQSRLSDGDAYCSAGSAAYHTRDFVNAKALFEKALDRKPDDIEILEQLRLVSVRLAEQCQCVYDFEAMASSASVDTPRVDVASCTFKTEVKASPGRARGLYATQAIDLGEVILVEKALCAIFEDETDAFHAVGSVLDTSIPNLHTVLDMSTALWKQVVQAATRNQSQADRLANLRHSYSAANLPTHDADGRNTLDIYRLHSVVIDNAFFCEHAVDWGFHRFGSDSIGLWAHASHINHACFGNGHSRFYGDILVLRASRPIAKGEEILTSYRHHSPTVAFEKQQKELELGCNSRYDCPLCHVEGRESDRLRWKRTSLQKEASQFVGTFAAETARLAMLRPRSVVTEVETLLCQIKKTYDSKVYRDLPRPVSCALSTNAISCR